MKGPFVLHVARSVVLFRKRERDKAGEVVEAQRPAVADFACKFRPLRRGHLAAFVSGANRHRFVDMHLTSVGHL